MVEERLARLEERVDSLPERFHLVVKESEARIRWWVLGTVLVTNTVVAAFKPTVAAAFAGVGIVGVAVKLLIPFLHR